MKLSRYFVFTRKSKDAPDGTKGSLQFQLVNNLSDLDVKKLKTEVSSAKSPDDTFIRALGNKFFTGLVRFRFGCNITDSLFFYPMFKKDITNTINLKSDDFTLCLELPVLVHQQNFRYTEILSEERERYAGKTKVNAFFDGLKILKGIYSIKK